MASSCLPLKYALPVAENERIRFSKDHWTYFSTDVPRYDGSAIFKTTLPILDE